MTAKNPRNRSRIRASASPRGGQRPATQRAPESQFSAPASNRSDLAAVERDAEAVAAPMVESTIQDGGDVRITPASTDQALWERQISRAFGVTGKVASEWSLTQLLNALGKRDGITTTDVNAGLAVMHSIRPRDEIEGMLAAQMVAVHIASMASVAPFHASTTLDQRNCNTTTLNKLMRTFAAQVEALTRYRGKGQQKVVVEHVHVHAYPGGQAFVGIKGGGGNRNESKDQPHALRTIESTGGPPLWGAFAQDGSALPSARDSGQDAVPDARRQGKRRAKGKSERLSARAILGGDDPNPTKREGVGARALPAGRSEPMNANGRKVNS